MNIHGVGTSIVESHSSIAILSLSIASLHFESEDSRLLLHIRTVDCLYTRIHPTHNCMLPNSRHPLSLSPSFFQRHVYSHLVGSPPFHPFRISGLVARCDNVHPVSHFFRRSVSPVRFSWTRPFVTRPPQNRRYLCSSATDYQPIK